MSDLLVISLVSGIASGSIYGLFGLSIVIPYRATGVINFAVAVMAMAAVYLGTTLLGLGLSVLIATVIAIVAAAVAGVVLRDVLIRPLGSSALFQSLVVTLGVALILAEGITVIWGQLPRRFPNLIDGTTSALGIVFRFQQFLIILIAGLAMLGIGYMFNRTALGTAMRAVAESTPTARLLGVSPDTIARVAWGLGMALAALGAILYAPTSGVTATALDHTLFRSIAGIFLGGLDSMRGAVVGGLAIGILDNLTAAFITATYNDSVVFALVVLFLLVRPAGMFGRPQFHRV